MTPPPPPLAHADAPSAPTPLCAVDQTPPPAGLVHSAQLFQGQRTLTIAHNGAVYRLQSTRQGKLILTK